MVGVSINRKVLALEHLPDPAFDMRDRFLLIPGCA